MNSSNETAVTQSWSDKGKGAGFSLVELMVALALGTFLLGGLIITYGSGRAAARDAESLSRVQESMRFVSDHLLRDLRNAGFRDQLTLTFAEFEAIGEAYAEINTDGSLSVRYAGRSHCAQPRQAFNLQEELTLVTNTYSVNAEGRLQCSGTGPGTAGTADIVTGLSDVSFEFIRPNPMPTTLPPGYDANVCNFNTDADLEAACLAVRVTLTFDGVDDQRDAVVLASFRNVLVDRIYGRN